MNLGYSPVHPWQTWYNRGMNDILGTIRRRSIVAMVLVYGLVALGMPLSAAADSNRDSEWWLPSLGVSQAWTVTKGSGVVIALIDNGADGTHPDLQDAFAGGTDVTGRGSKDGLTAVPSEHADPTDALYKIGHGTAMAAFIAGRGHGTANADGIIGTAPESKLLSISSNTGTSTPSEISTAIHYAVAHGARVINLSFTGDLSAADVAYLEQHDVVVVAGAGNDATAAVVQPANFFGVVAVGGVDQNLQHDPNANYGGPGNIAGTAESGGLAVAAPYSTTAGGLYTDFGGTTFSLATTVQAGSYENGVSGGTSSATAITAGIVALIRAQYPKMNAANVINRLIKTATPAASGRYDPTIGFGVPNAYKALTADVAAVCENPLGSEVTHSSGVWQSMIDHKPYQPKTGCSPNAIATIATTTPAKKSSSTLLVAGGIALAAIAIGSAAILSVKLRQRRTLPQPSEQQPPYSDTTPPTA